MDASSKAAQRLACQRNRRAAFKAEESAKKEYEGELQKINRRRSYFRKTYGENSQQFALISLEHQAFKDNKQSFIASKKEEFFATMMTPSRTKKTAESPSVLAIPPPSPRPMSMVDMMAAFREKHGRDPSAVEIQALQYDRQYEISLAHQSETNVAALTTINNLLAHTRETVVATSSPGRPPAMARGVSGRNLDTTLGAIDEDTLYQDSPLRSEEDEKPKAASKKRRAKAASKVLTVDSLESEDDEVQVLPKKRAGHAKKAPTGTTKEARRKEESESSEEAEEEVSAWDALEKEYMDKLEATRTIKPKTKRDAAVGKLVQALVNDEGLELKKEVMPELMVALAEELGMRCSKGTAFKQLRIYLSRK